MCDDALFPSQVAVSKPVGLSDTAPSGSCFLPELRQNGSIARRNAVSLGVIQKLWAICEVDSAKGTS